MYRRERSHRFYSTNRTYDCIDEKSPYLAIIHYTDYNREGYYRQDSKSIYCCVFVSKDLLVNKTLIETLSKEEVKIWMNLNGYKITEKVVVYYHDTKKIHLEMFKLERI